MSPKNGTAIDLTVAAASVTMSVDTTVDDYVLTIESVEMPKPSSQSEDDTS